MNKKTLLALTISGALLALNVSAANKVADARGNAMGNTGVASADYLTAPFYNPALVADFKDNDDFGIMLSAGITANDEDDTLTMIDDLQSSIDDSDTGAIDEYLSELEGNKLSVNVGVGLAVAIPTKLVSANLFVRGYTEIFAVTDIDTTDYTKSYVDLLAFGYGEMGLALAKEFKIAGERVSFGVTPKFQKMTTYAQHVSVETFDIDDYDESKNTKNAMNIDLGAAWYKDNFRAAIAIKDLFSQTITAASTGVSDAYKLNTQVTLGGAYSSDYFTAAIDADLTKQTRFEDQDDDTQFVRLGVEGNAWGWAQLRAGYEIDLQGTLDNSITAGIGLSPFDLFSLDLAGSYAGDNQFGASLGLAVTF